jgi:hypothetical protein
MFLKEGRDAEGEIFLSKDCRELLIGAIVVD